MTSRSPLMPPRSPLMTSPSPLALALLLGCYAPSSVQDTAAGAADSPSGGTIWGDAGGAGSGSSSGSGSGSSTC